MPRDLPDAAGAVFRFIAERTGAADVGEARVAPLAGGAVLRHWRLDFTLRGGALPGRQSWVLRSDGATKLGLGLTRAREFALQRALFEAGILVAEPLFMGCDAGVVGAPFFLMRRLDGVADGEAVTRQGENRRLAEALARQLARLHRIEPCERWHCLGLPPEDAAAARLALLETALDADDDPHPIAHWALRWLRRRKPSPARPVLCHGDFRTGNYLVAQGRLSAILDWDFAHWGDPDEDIAWFCSRHWRFGEPARAAGGIARRDDFWRAYEAASGRKLESARLAFWAVMASLHWLVIALKQRDRFRKQGEASLDLALTGRRVAECEHEILALTSGCSAPVGDSPGAPSRSGDSAGAGTAFRDRPGGEDLAALARRFGGDALAERAMAIAARECDGAGAAFAGCRAMLAARYGAGDDRALLTRFAAEIRSGRFDPPGERDGALAIMTAIARAKLSESNPGFLEEQARLAASDPRP